MRSIPPLDMNLAIVLLRTTVELKQVIATWDAAGPEAAKARLEGAVVELHQEYMERMVGVMIDCPHCGEAVAVVAIAGTGECPRCFKTIGPED